MAESAPIPVTDLDDDDRVAMIFDLWETGVQDTMDIAEATGLSEPEVCRLLDEYREAGR